MSRAGRAARRRLRGATDRKQRRKAPLAVEISNLLPPAALAALAALRAQQAHQSANTLPGKGMAGSGPKVPATGLLRPSAGALAPSAGALDAGPVAS